MRHLMISAGILALMITPALAQSRWNNNDVITGPPGLPSEQPLVHHPTNLNEPTAHRWSPALPQPDISVNASVSHYLHNARRALANDRLGLAQSSLEQAERAALNDQALWQGYHQRYNPTAQHIQDALRALGNREPQVAMNIVERTIPMAQSTSAQNYGGYDYRSYR